MNSATLARPRPQNSEQPRPAYATQQQRPSLDMAFSAERYGFLSLPPEIRNMIYQELFNDDTRLEVSAFGPDGRPSIAFVGTGRRLLETCKTTNREARRLLEDHTTLHVSTGLIRGSYGNLLPDAISTGIESFTRKMRLNGVMLFCTPPQLDLSAFHQLRRLEFTINAFNCCIRKNLQVACFGDGQLTAEVLQRHWLANAARGWGLVRRIERIEVEVDPDDDAVYNFCITLNPPRSTRRRSGRVLVSYAEQQD